MEWDDAALRRTSPRLEQMQQGGAAPTGGTGSAPGARRGRDERRGSAPASTIAGQLARLEAPGRTQPEVQASAPPAMSRKKRVT